MTKALEEESKSPHWRERHLSTHDSNRLSVILD